jgi:hypothetical protein
MITEHCSPVQLKPAREWWLPGPTRSRQPSRQEAYFLKGVALWYCLLPHPSRKLLVSAPPTPGINHRAAPGAVDGCGGMDLLSPGLAVSHCVYLRRLFCSQCRAVHRLKPRGYWPRYRSSSAEIQQAITHRQSTKRWRPDLPRSRQRQWWRRLGRMIRLVFGMSAQLTHREGFTRLIARNIIPVTQAIHHDNRHIHDPPYRIVALPGGL